MVIRNRIVVYSSYLVSYFGGFYVFSSIVHEVRIRTVYMYMS